MKSWKRSAKSDAIFIDAFVQAYSDSLNSLRLDSGGVHNAKPLNLSDNLRLVFLPRYCPELNPIERLWRDLKDALGRQPFNNMAQQREAVANVLCVYDAQTVQSLTGYTYLVDAINALSS